MTKLYNQINDFLRANIDKVAHYGLSLNLVLLLTPILTLYAACFITILIGLLYEIYGNKDWADFLADLLGVAMAVLLNFALKGMF